MQTIIRNIKKEPLWPLLKTARKEVFVIEQGLDACVVADEHDETCTHILYADANQVIASCRVRIDNATAYIERVSVIKPFRHKSLSKGILNEALSFIDKTSVASIEIVAQSRLVSMYEKYGFSAIGGPYIAFGVSHIKMIKSINT